MRKVTPFLMFNDQLEAAIEFYTATFPDSHVKNVNGVVIAIKGAIHEDRTRRA